MLTQKCQAEQTEAEVKIEQLKASIAAEKQTAADAEKWIGLIKKYGTLPS